MKKNDIIEGESYNSREIRNSKSSNRNLLMGLLVIVVLFLGVVSTGILLRNQQDVRQFADSTPYTYLATFDGSPASPQPFNNMNQNQFEVAVQSRNNDTWDSLPAFDMSHGTACEAPITATATAPYTGSELVTHHTNGNYDDAVFNCKDHVMTGIFGIGKSVNDGYGLISLTPAALVDFTNGEATISWSMSTFRTTQRDFVDVWITPWEDSIQLPFDQAEFATVGSNGKLQGVDVQGAPKNAVEITMFAPNSNSKTGFKPVIYVNGQETGEFKKFSSDYNWYTGYEDYLPGGAGDPKRRDKFEIKISKNHISICMPQDSSDNAPSQTICWADKTIKALPFTVGTVQFVQHSYTPNKDCSFYSPLVCGPNTWHWDDILISPAIPFSMIKANVRMVKDENTPVVFNQPAPANSKLRFAAAGSTQVSFNNGPFQSAKPQYGNLPDPTHVANYMIDIPAGTTNVRFKMTDTGAGGVMAKDFSIWTRDITSIPTSAPTATTMPTVSQSTPTPTPIPSIPTATPTKIPTPTATPKPTSTPIPTATPKPTATPTKAPNPTATPTPQANTSWVGQYYQFGRNSNTKGLNGTPKLVRTDPNVNFNWGLGSPTTSIKSDRYSVRWTSNPFMSAGTYQFKTVSDDGVRVYLDGKLLSSASLWSDHATTTRTQNVSVSEGIHTIVVEYYENGGFANIQFSYTKL